MSISTPCEHCSGKGQTESDRAKLLDELSDPQLDFLLEADLVRHGDTEEAREEIEQARQQSGTGNRGHGPNIPPSEKVPGQSGRVPRR